MKESYFDITGGLMLSFDASSQKELLLKSIKSALIGGVDVVGLYNTKYIKGLPHELINEINREAGKFDVPLIVIDHWEMLNEAHFDGVYFTGIPEDFNKIEQKLSGDFILGVECSSKEEVIWSNENESDFCIINIKALSEGEIKKLSEINTRTLFLAGIANREELKNFREISFDGVFPDKDAVDGKNFLQITESFKTALSMVFSHE
ncbi:thiamine phosphate synthase [Mangrovivirga sp. M17]|uniref:Thiamine phosphate synthase n=1 Tax=Mangrovivirga halotolerans TaxID=2993936 RepID=A0ABT3RNJ9_9BACT|nr:thiamine phosphate synthase [Mangrovivirga halotolerans]MCX2743103.1 thiamine phosphate synthase [Mangrovivirga halotolerans]